MNPAHIVRRVVIRGHVQRVGYRAWTEHAALQRGLEGWVRNRSDGTVEAVFAGSATVVEGMIEACRRGPPGAQVDALDQREGGLDEVALRRRGEMFSVLPTSKT
jgi:acylphosphatase